MTDNGFPTSSEYRAWRERTNYGENCFPHFGTNYLERYKEAYHSGSAEKLDRFCNNFLSAFVHHVSPRYDEQYTALYAIIEHGPEKWKSQAWDALLQYGRFEGDDCDLRRIIEIAPDYWRGEACEKLLEIYKNKKCCNYLRFIIQNGPSIYRVIALVQLIDRYTSGKADDETSAVACHEYINKQAPKHLQDGLFDRLVSRLTDEGLYRFCCSSWAVHNEPWQFNGWQRLFRNQYPLLLLFKFAAMCFDDHESIEKIKAELLKRGLTNKELCDVVTCNDFRGGGEWRIWAFDLLIQQSPTAEDLAKIILYCSGVLKNGANSYYYKESEKIMAKTIKVLKTINK